VNSNSFPLLSMISKSPVGSSKSIEWEHKLIDPHVSTNLGLEGINKLGTNKF